MQTDRLIAVLLVLGASFSQSVSARDEDWKQPRDRSARTERSQATQDVAPKPNADAVTLVDFKKRVDEYVALHKQIARDSPPFKETNNPAEIKVAQEALGLKIRAAREAAQPGDIFTADIRATFRKLLGQEIVGEDGQDAKKVMKDDAPASFPLKVNGRYPEGATLPSVPASVLANLPPLPAEVEYRIIDKHLILRDTKANIVVDFIPNAVR